MKNMETPNFEQLENLDFLLLVSLKKAIKINEGNNGIIKKIKPGEMSQELVKYISENIDPDFDKNNEFVFKLIKVYTEGGKGELEFKAQKRAYDIVEKAKRDGRTEYADIPHPYVYKSISLDDDVKQILKLDGLTMVQDKIELIIMDFVEGEDLATMLYKEVIKRHPSTRDLVSQIDSLSLQEIQERVSLALGFNSPGGKSRDEMVRAVEAEKVYNDNAQKIINFLKKSDFILDKPLMEKIEKTIKLFHDNAFKHNDLHERNIMIHGDKLFFIDFGEAVYTDENGKVVQVKEQALKNKRYVDDEMIPRRYKTLSQSKEDDINMEKNKFIAEINSIKEIIEQRPELSIECKAIFEKINDSNYESLSDQFALKAGINSDMYWKFKLFIIANFLSKKPIAEKMQKISDLIVKFDNENIQFRNLLEKYYKILVNEKET